MHGLRGHATSRRSGIVVVIVAAAAALLAGPALAAWSRAVSLTKPGAQTGFPTVASNGRGVAVVAWYRIVGNADQMVARTSTDSGRTWGPRQLLGRAVVAQGGGRPAEVHAAVAANGTAAVVWQQPTGPNKHRVVGALARRGARFGPVRVLSGPEPVAGYPDVAFDGSGRAVVVWITPNQVQRVAVSANGTMSPRRVIATGRIPDEPVVAVNPRGERVFAWIQSTLDAIHFYIWVAREGADGRLTPPQRLAHRSQGQIPLPQAAIAPGGRSTVVYEQAIADTDVVWATSALPGRRFGPGQRLSHPGRFAILGGGGSGGRGVGVDAAGRVNAIWEETPPPGTTGSSFVRVGTANPAGRFGAPRTVQAVTGQDTFERPAIGIAPGGGVVAAWAELLGGLSGRARVFGSAAGGPGRPFSPAKLLSGAHDDFPAAAATAQGGAGVAVWEHGASGVVTAARWSP